MTAPEFRRAGVDERRERPPAVEVGHRLRCDSLAERFGLRVG
jgi:hypothetical protein